MVSKKESGVPLKKNTSKHDVPHKKVDKEVSARKSSRRPWLVMVAVGTVVAMAAVIYMDTDVQYVLEDLIQRHISNKKANHDQSTKAVPSDTHPHSNKEKTPTENIHKEMDRDEAFEQDADVISERIFEPEVVVKPENVVASTESESSQSQEQVEENELYAKRSITNKADFKIRKKLDAADEQLERDELEVAGKKYDSILKKYPNSPRAMYGKAQVVDKLAEKQRSNALLEESIALADKALRMPNVPGDLLLQIADRLSDRQQFRGWMSKSLKTRKYVADKFPEDVQLQNKLGVAYIMSHQNSEAKEIFKQVLERKSDDGFALSHLGFLYKTIDNAPEKAIPLLREGILTRDSGTVDGRFYMQLGDALQRVGDNEEAYVFYREGAELGLFRSPYQRSLYNSEVDSHPWWTLEQTGYYKYFKMLEENWETIRDEGLAQMDPKTGSFLPEEENLREVGDWKQFTLYQRGKKIEKSCAKTPQTCSLIDRFPDAKSCKRGQVKFSVMQPGVHVWPHCGPTNCRIRAHLGLVVPDGPRIRVVNETRIWKEGKFIVFDDSFEHEVWHDGTELRLVLIVDVWHPDISTQERLQLSPI